MSDSSELKIGCFPFVMFGIVLGPTIFVVTSGYSVLEKVLLDGLTGLVGDTDAGYMADAARNGAVRADHS